MKIIKEILIKQVITEKSKQILEKKFIAEKFQLEKECEHLIFEKRKLQKQIKSSQNEIANRFQLEIDNRKRSITQIAFKIEQLHQLPLGSEITESSAESIINVEIGTDWTTFNDETSIIVKDGLVIRIDNE